MAQGSCKGVGGREENRPTPKLAFFLVPLEGEADGQTAAAPPLSCCSPHWCSREGLIAPPGMGDLQCVVHGEERRGL